MATAIPAVKAAIAATLNGAAGLEDVVVATGKEPERESEYVWVWRGSAKRDFASVGVTPAPLNEEVRITLRVVAIRGGTDPTASEERAFELAEAVETALRANSSLDETALFQHIEELEEEPLQFDRKWGCHVLMVVAAKARI